MNIMNYALGVFERLKQASPGNGTEIVYASEQVEILDAGVQALGGWSTGKALVEALSGGLGYVNFGEFNLNNFAIPSVDLFLDSPSKVCLSSMLHRQVLAGMTAFSPSFNQEPVFGFAEVEKLPEQIAEDVSARLLISRPTSLVAAIYNSALAVPRAIELVNRIGLSEQSIVWAWGSCPVAILCDDVQAMRMRKDHVLQYGAVVSLWVRDSDQHLEQVVEQWNNAGEIRIHNLVTAKTFIGGKWSEAQLIQSLL